MSKSKHQIQPIIGVENERADAGRDRRTCLARPYSQTRSGTGHGRDWQLYRLIPTQSAERDDPTCNIHLHT